MIHRPLIAFSSFILVLLFLSVSTAEIYPLPKEYIIKDKAFVTPKSHPSLFSFNGRWMRHRETYVASKWPGTSVNVLIFGQECSLKLRPPIKDGAVDNHKFLVSVDGGPQLVLSLPSYGAHENTVFDVKVDLPPLEGVAAEELGTKKQLIPHIVEFMSDESTPLHLVGVSMANTLITQGHSWIKAQGKIPHVEFVSDKISSVHPVVNQSPLYIAARSLNIRQTWIHKYDTCFTKGICSNNTGSLSEQYEWLSPFNGPIEPASERDIRPVYHVFNRDQPLFHTSEPQYVVVDVGENDKAKGVPGDKFLESLQNLLGNMVVNYRPDSEIFVLIREGRYVKETEDAIISMRNNRIHAVKFGTETVAWYKYFLCSYILPLADRDYPYTEMCGTAYEQLSMAHSGIGSLFKILLVIAFVVTIVGTLYRHRITVLSYVRGYIPQRSGSFGASAHNKGGLLDDPEAGK